MDRTTHLSDANTIFLEILLSALRALVVPSYEDITGEQLDVEHLTIDQKEEILSQFYFEGEGSFVDALRAGQATAVISTDFSQQAFSSFSIANRGKFSLYELQVLLSFAEAYVLHDNVVVLDETPRDDTIPYLGSYELPIQPWIVSRRPIGLTTLVSGLLSPYTDSAELAEDYDIELLLREMSRGNREDARPLMQRSWSVASLAEAIRRRRNVLATAEIRLCSDWGAAYFPNPLNTDQVVGAVAEIGRSTLGILRQFERMRAIEFGELTRLLAPSPVAFAPPILLAVAVENADTIGGFWDSLSQLRLSRDTAKFRRLLCQLVEERPADAIGIAKSMDDEMRRILGAAQVRRVPTLEGLVSMPPAPTGLDPISGGIEVARGVIGAAKTLRSAGEVLRHYRTRRHLALLQRLHRASPNIHGFYTGLRRVFGPLAFSEAELLSWLEKRAESMVFPAQPRRPDAVERLHELVKHANSRLKSPATPQESDIRSPPSASRKPPARGRKRAKTARSRRS